MFFSQKEGLHASKTSGGSFRWRVLTKVLSAMPRIYQRLCCISKQLEGLWRSLPRFEMTRDCPSKEPARYILAAQAARAAKKAKAATASNVPSIQDPAAERKDRRHHWLISVGRLDLVPKPKSQGRKGARSKTRPDAVAPQASQQMSQVMKFDSLASP